MVNRGQDHSNPRERSFIILTDLASAVWCFLSLACNGFHAVSGYGRADLAIERDKRGERVSARTASRGRDSDCPLASRWIPTPRILHPYPSVLASENCAKRSDQMFESSGPERCAGDPPRSDPAFEALSAAPVPGARAGPIEDPAAGIPRFREAEIPAPGPGVAVVSAAARQGRSGPPGFRVSGAVELGNRI